MRIFVFKGKEIIVVSFISNLLENKVIGLELRNDNEF